MKAFKNLLPFVLFIIAVFGSALLVSGQNAPSEKELEIKRLVESREFVFQAQTANPQGSRQRNLTSEYSVLFTKDTITSDLPYFGRAYSANIGSSDGGIVFTSLDFDYKVANRKKGGWDITITPKDQTGGKQMFLTIFDNGNATLSVNSNSRQAISYTGYIEARKFKE